MLKTKINVLYDKEDMIVIAMEKTHSIVLDWGYTRIFIASDKF